MYEYTYIRRRQTGDRSQLKLHLHILDLYYRSSETKSYIALCQPNNEQASIFSLPATLTATYYIYSYS